MAVINEYAKAVLDRMVTEADKGVWTGHITKLVAEVAPLSYTTKITTLLTEAGAIKRVQRGANKNPSVYRILDAEPELPEYNPEQVVPKQTRDTNHRLELLEQSIRGLDIHKAFADILVRVEALERKDNGKHS